MASTVPRSTASEPDPLFSQHDDGLGPTSYAPPYQHSRHLSFPMCTPHSEPTSYAVAANMPLTIFSQPQTFDFVSSATAAQATFWPSPPLSVGPDQVCFDAI